MWIEYNENPAGHRTGDCTVRAISIALDVDWDTAFEMLVTKAFEMKVMPSTDAVWGAVLRSAGFFRRGISNYCPDCYNVAEFASEHPRGTYVLATGGHVVCVKDGNYYDLFDSGDEIPLYYYERRSE